MYSGTTLMSVDDSLGDILKPTDILITGEKYTFTFSHGRIFEYRTADWVKERLTYFMQNWGDIILADRPLFSNRYIVVVVPKVQASLSQWLSAFDYSWKNMGYGSATLVLAEGGIGSSQPGGATQLIKGAAETAGETAAAVVKPLTPVLIIIAITALGITLLQRGKK
jgi:hypothetical protein